MISKFEIDFKAAKQNVKQLQGQSDKACDHEADCLEAQEILQAVAQTIQQQAHERISYVVSHCLAAVFDEPYEFKIEFERKRGRTEARLTLIRGDLVLGDPLDAAGGGVVDVASFALRLSTLLLSRPPKRRLVVMDESFKFLHPARRRPRIVAMMEKLAVEFGVQFIVVTGIEELEAGKVIVL